MYFGTINKESMSRTVKYAHRYAKEKTREKYIQTHGMKTREDKAGILREKRMEKRKNKQLEKNLLKEELNNYLNEKTNLIITTII